MRKVFYIIGFLTASSIISCSKSFLNEKPLDFLSTDNAFVTYTDFNASIYNMYNLVRSEFYTDGENRPFDFLFGTDLVYDGQPSVQRHTNMTAAYAPIGSAGIPLYHWKALYKIISEANTTISRIPSSEMDDNQKELIEARARFFRAFAYRTLAYLFGGVPITLEELKAPKTDYTRASKEEVLTQVIEDLTYATQHLPKIEEVQDGEISDLVAWHLLSEVYLAAKEFHKAVDAASMVINNPNVHLMLNRFGTKANTEPGDVYFDLFQQGNQNRKSGNMEGLWVIQFETDVLGGGSKASSTDGSYKLERQGAPQFINLRVPGGGSVSPIQYPTSDFSGGRGIGWAIPDTYFSDTIWQKDWNTDIRNAGHNFVREYVATNPESPLYGDTISTIHPPAGMTVPNRFLYAYQSKVTTPGDHPSALFADKSKLLLKSTGGATYRDFYMFRLAETYLLRAEGYLGLNNLDSAAIDINAVRSRSHASSVNPSEIDIDYILDERMREFGVEERRRLTLMRIGVWYDRVKRCNPYYSDAAPKYNLWPIPAEEIERNKDGHLEQNPGY